MRIYLAISYFDQVGGSEEQLALLAVRLVQLGNQVVVFTRLPVNRSNQYASQILQNHIRVAAPPAWLANLLGDWYSQDRLVRGLARAAFPLLVPAAAAAALIRRQPFWTAYASAAGRLRRFAGSLIYADRTEKLLELTLGLWARFYRPDLIHVFRFDLHGLLRWAEERHIPSVYYELITPSEEMLARSPENARRAANINRATLVQAISESTALTLKTGMGITRPIDVVYPYIKNLPASVARRGETSACTITCIARLSSEKGIGDLLTAAQSLRSAHPQVRLLIAGSGPLKEALVEQAGQLGIAGQVTFYGAYPRSDLEKIMAQTDIFVLPSYLEGLPFVIIEAMAYARPVVATDVGGVCEVVEDQKTGIVVPAGRPEILSRALARLVEDEPLRWKMGAAGREKVMNGPFSEKGFVDTVLAGYDRAAAAFRAQTLQSKGKAA